METPNEQEVMVLNVEDMAVFIVEKTGLDLDTVNKVLDAEGDYYISIGLAEPIEE